MKHLTFIFLLLASLAIQAQSLRVSSGYSHGKPEVLGTRSTSDGSNFSNEVICGSLGSGVDLGLTAGFEICDFFEFILRGDCFTGFDQEVGESTTSYAGDRYYNQDFMKYSRFSIGPGFRLNTGNKESKVRYFGEAGLKLPVYNNTRIRQISENPFTDPQEVTIMRKDAFSPGMFFGLGVSNTLGEKLSFFGQLQGTAISGKTKSSKVTKVVENGMEQDLSTRTPYEISTEYTMKVDNNSNNALFNQNFNSEMPKEELEMSNNYSSSGVYIGLEYKF